MKKVLFLAMAAAMLFLTAISAAAMVPQALPGNFTLAAVIDSGQPGEYVVDETQSPIVYHRRIKPTPKFAENGIVQFPVNAGDLILKVQLEKSYQFVDEFSFPYMITEEDCANGKLIRIKVVPDEPDPPEPPEPDDPDPNPDPIVPDPVVPDPDTPDEPAPMPLAANKIQAAIQEEKPAWNTGGKVGMLKGSQPLNPGGILLGSLNKPLPHTETPAEMRQAAQAAALNIQDQPGDDPMDIQIPLRNGDIMSPETAKDITGAVKEVLGSDELPGTVIVEADTVTMGEVAARIYINLEKLEQNSDAIDVRIDNDPESGQNQAVRAHFERYFDNRLVTATFKQQGTFGMEISVAMKTDLSGLNREALFFYAYNARENTYLRMDTGYALDSHGYLHFNTEQGGSVIITDAPLKPVGVRPWREHSPGWGP